PRRGGVRRRRRRLGRRRGPCGLRSAPPGRAQPRPGDARPPRLDVLRALNKTGSTARVVVVSAFSPAYGARAVDALAEGAFELVEKPNAGTPPTVFLAELCDKVELAARSGA